MYTVPATQNGYQPSGGHGEYERRHYAYRGSTGRERGRERVTVPGNERYNLDLALKQAGLSRDDVYITNTVRCRPPGNRNPKVGEVTACKPNLQDVIDTVNPKIIVTVGLVSTKRFIPVKNMKDVVGHAHGNIVPMLHPASYLYSGRSPKVMDSMVLSLTLAQQTVLQSSMPKLAQRH